MSGMNFSKAASIEGILQFIRPKIEQLLSSSKYGITICVSPQVRRRSIEQNRYLWGIYSHIVQFFSDTGFIPDALNVKFINSDFLHAYFKARFDVKETKKMSTADFCKYCDQIQQLMIEQSHGEYDPIYPEQPFQIMEN